MCNFIENMAAGIQGLPETARDGVRMLDNTPAVLQSVGLDDLPVLIGVKHCVKAQNAFNDELNDHGIPLATLEQVPEYLGKPAFIFDSEKRRDTVVAVLNLYDPMDQPLFVCIHCNGDQYGEKVNYITGLYGKRKDGVAANYKRAIRDGRLLYVNKEAFEDLKTHVSFSNMVAYQTGIITRSNNAASTRLNTERYNRRYHSYRRKAETC